MPRLPCLLHLEKAGWRLVSPSFSEAQTESHHAFEIGSPLIDQVPLILQELSSAHQDGAPVLLALDASRCLAITMDVANPQMFRKPQLLHFELEGWIPWSAEEYLSDFIGHRDQAFVIAARQQELTSLMHALEAEGVLIAAVTPTVLLALAHHLQEKSLPAEHCLLWQDNESIDLFEMRQGKPWKWTRLPAEVKDVVVSQQLIELTASTARKWYSRRVSAELLQSLEPFKFETAVLSPLYPLEAANIAAQAIAKGQQEPLIDLRQHGPGSQRHFQALGKQWSRLKLALVVLLACIGVLLYLVGQQYQRATDHVEEQLSKTYRELFHETPEIPASAVGKSIEKELELLRGTRSPTGNLPAPTAADQLLEKVLLALPTDIRFRVPEILIEQERVTLSAEVRSNTDADLLVAALRENGFTVSPPRTQRLAKQGFSARIQAKVSADSSIGKNSK